MRNIIKRWILAILIILLTITITFNNLMNSFYEQEEWLGLGNVFVYGSNYLTLIFQHGVLKVLLGEGRILSSPITYFFYNVFPFNSLPISLFAVLLHTINSLLVFYLLRVLFKSTFPALFGALFFSVNAVAQSAVTWGASISTLPATTFVLFSHLAFFKSINYLEQDIENKRQIKQKWLAISFVLLYVSILFKQIGIFLIPLYIFTAKLYSSEKLDIKTMLGFSKKYILLLSIFLIIILIYLFTFMFKNGPDVLFITGSSANFYQILVTRTFLYPLTSLSQLFIPPELFLTFARYITNLYYPFFPPEQFILIAQTVVLDLLSVIFSVVILLLIYGLSRKSTPPDKMKIWFFVIFTVLTFLPYVLISKTFSYFDSRYYYPGVIGASYLIAWVVNKLSKFSRKVGWLFCVLIIYLIIVHSFAVKLSIDKQVNVGIERKSLLSQLSGVKPELTNKKNIFYVTGDSDFYLPGHKVPFQNGFGHTLSVWYFHTGLIPQELISNGKLFEIGSQGYYEYGELGFGYFSDKSLLNETLEKYHLSPSVVIPVYYEAKNKKLINITGKDLEMLNGNAN